MSEAVKSKEAGVSNNATTDKRLLAYFKPFKSFYIGGLACTAVCAALQTYFFFLIQNVVKSTLETDPAGLNRVALTIVGVHLVKWVFTFGQTYLISAATQKVAIGVRNDLFSHLQHLSLSFFERSKVGHLMSRMTNDIGLIQGAAPQIVQAVSAPLMILGALGMIFHSNWRLALVSIVVLPFMSYTIYKIGRGMKKLTERLQIRLAEVASIVQETLSAVRVVKSFGMEDYEIDRFAEENAKTYQSAMRAVKRNAALAPTLEVIGVSGIAFVLWYGGGMVVNNSVPGFGTPQLLAFLVFLNSIASSIRDIGRINVTYHQTMAGAQRIFDVLDESPDIQDRPNAIALPPLQGRVEFRGVSFAYLKSKKVIEDVSFVAEPGQQIALVGPSGAGKSTIANLVPRFYDISDGSILVDGLDIRTVTVKSLRSSIGIVPQETVLFSTSIGENIAYGKMDASQDEIIAAAKAANAHEFIDRLPEKYCTLVGERGTRLSGGERQRVAIARALLKNPKLLILDEATSALDVASEAVVQDALERLMKDRTTIVIAHRLSTIVNADKILVMERGRIVESGAHRELMALGGLYAELYAVQSKNGAPNLVATGGRD
jgi:ATP-binding cassette, subfamily B, bacterial MsbA